MSCYAIGCGDVRLWDGVLYRIRFLLPGRTCTQHPHHIFFVFFSRANIGIILLYTNILDRYYVPIHNQWKLRSSYTVNFMCRATFEDRDQGDGEVVLIQ